MKLIASIIVLLFLFYGCASSSEKNINLSPVKINKIDKKNREYMYLLSPQNSNKFNRYSRREIESFLCTLVPDFITAKDIELSSKTEIIFGNTVSKSFYYIRSKKLRNRELITIKKNEVNKWFEPKVYVSCTGNYSQSDLHTIKLFFFRINKIIGEDKFIFGKKNTPKNIVIEFLDKELRVGKFMGFSTKLEDNLKVFFTESQNCIKLQTGLLKYYFLFKNSKHLTFSDKEYSYMKNNRFIKVFINNIKDPKIRIRTIFHELFHAIGFSNHSPYSDSVLFPIILPLHNTKNNSVFSELDRTMVEMLYRSEILPSITIEEAGAILSSLKSKKKIKKNDLLRFFVNRKNFLLNKKTELLNIANIDFKREKKIIKELNLLDNHLTKMRDTNKIKSEKNLFYGSKIKLLKEELSKISSKKKKILKRLTQIIRQLKTIDSEIEILKK